MQRPLSSIMMTRSVDTPSRSSSLVRMPTEGLRWPFSENGQELDKYARQFTLVAHNYAIDLGLEKRYEEAERLARRDRQTDFFGVYCP